MLKTNFAIANVFPKTNSDRRKEVFYHGFFDVSCLIEVSPIIICCNRTFFTRSSTRTLYCNVSFFYNLTSRRVSVVQDSVCFGKKSLCSSAVPSS